MVAKTYLKCLSVINQHFLSCYQKLLPLIKTYIVDAFTDQPFKGNPAGVCLVDTTLSEEQMLSIAQELGLSETAFVLNHQKEAYYSIRYFSPVMEIPLCGHATLASSKVLFEQVETKEIRFRTIQDITLDVTMEDGLICMRFPIYQTRPSTAPKALLDALGIREVNHVVYNEETKILLLEISSAKKLSNLSPDFKALKAAHSSINGVLITAPSGDDEFDFHSRYFWPWSGTNEDPATGGTHTFLTSYWAMKLGKTKMKSFQSSKRTGWMEVELVDDSTLIIRSQAVIFLEGNLHL